MTVKSAVRRALLFLLWPRVFKIELALLRAFALLPPRGKGVWPPRAVLIVNPTPNLGDTIMMLPTVDALKRALPEVQIDLVTDRPLAEPLRVLPSLRRVIVFSASKTCIPVLGHFLRVGRMFRFARHQLKGQAYDLALLPRWGTDPFLSAYLAAMSTAPVRCGHDPHQEEGAEQVLSSIHTLLTTVSHGGAGMAEGVREQLILTACGIAGQFDPGREERRTTASLLYLARFPHAAAIIGRLGLTPDQPFILLAPGASDPARRWPAERFAALGAALSRSSHATVYTIGAPGDCLLGSKIEEASQGQIRSLVGQTTVLETIALTHQAALLVTNDSGPAHVGGGLGVPTLVLSVCPRTSTREHANSPRRVRPVGPRVSVLQPPQAAPGCGERCLAAEAHCILGLDVPTVLREAEQLLALYSDEPDTLRTGRSTTAGAPAATL